MIAGESSKASRPPPDGSRAVVNRCGHRLRESHEEERESHEEEKPCLRLVKVLFCVIKHLFWLVTPDFLVLPSLIPEPCYRHTFKFCPISDYSSLRDTGTFMNISCLKTICKLKWNKLKCYTMLEINRAKEYYKSLKNLSKQLIKNNPKCACVLSDRSTLSQIFP